ncbi:MAG: hypothetical protein AAF357_08590, partial [Verrucomicrobiota bacterium]
EELLHLNLFVGKNLVELISESFHDEKGSIQIGRHRYASLNSAATVFYKICLEKALFPSKFPVRATSVANAGVAQG